MFNAYAMLKLKPTGIMKKQNKTQWQENMQGDVTTGSPSSLGIVNMTLCDSVIIRVCMRKK